MDDENLKKQNKFNSTSNQLKIYISSNLTQIIIVFIILFPTIIITFATFTSIWFSQKVSIDLINNFAEQLFQDQIESSKQQNMAVVFQLNSQIQKIPWQINLLNEFQGKNLLNTVIKNTNYHPAIHNIDRSFYMNENKTVLNMFLKNQILTSVWHHVNISYLKDLDEREIQQLNYAYRLDSIWKAIKFDNKNQNTLWLKIKDIFTAHDYDGLIYMTSINTTYTSYPIPPGCPFNGTYKFDIRCRFYYNPTMANISTVLYDPQIFYTNAQPYLASVFCQRRLRYFIQDPNSQAEKYYVLCISLDLTQTPQYFQNFGKNSKLQIFIDPRKLTVVYDSLVNIKRDEILKVQQAETDYLQDKSQAQILIDNISLMSRYILDRKDNIKEFQVDPQQIQKTFFYNRNGTDCFVIQNLITMVDKIPSYEVLKRGSTSKKFELKSAFIFLDVLSKEKMTQYSDDLQNKINYYNKIFGYFYGILIALATIFQIYFSIILGRLLIRPIIHLTSVLKQIKIKTKTIQQQNLNNFKESSQGTFQTLNENFKNQKDSFQSDSSIVSFEDQIQFEFNIDSDFDGFCFSRDTQELLNSFQNMFKILKFTNSNIIKQNESTSLLNLNMQVQYFEKFCNYRALGVCYNNIGVIHYNSGRYQESEALENFQKAVIYANYELNIYSHQEEGAQFSNSIKRFTVHLRSSLQNNVSSKENTVSTNYFKISNIQEKSKSKTANYFIIKVPEMKEKNLDMSKQNQKVEFYWSLYNRKTNLFKAMLMFIQVSKAFLWDILEDLALENLSISQFYLPPSYKREIINYYALSKGVLNQNSSNEVTVLNKLSQIYIKIYEAKYDELNQQPAIMLTTQSLKFTKQVRKKGRLKNNQQKQQNSIFFKQSSNNKPTDDSKMSHRIIQESDNKLILNQQNIFSPNISGINNRLSLSQLIQFQDSKNRLEEKTVKRNSKQIQFNQQLTHSQNLEIPQNINQKPRKSILKNSSMQNTNSDTCKASSQKQNKHTQFFVRKHKNNQQVRNYQYSSDIYFQYCSLEQAQYQVKQQNFYSAALMLTNSLEQCQQYLPHLKKLEMDLLLEIFKKQEIKSIYLEVKTTTSIKLIQSNPQLLEQIFLSLLLKKHHDNMHKVVNNKTFNQFKNTHDHSNQYYHLPSTSQDKHFSQDMNFHLLVNLNHHLKIDSFSKLESPQLRSSQDSQIEIFRLDSDYHKQDKKKVSQINKTSKKDLENSKTIFYLNSLNNKQITEQANKKSSFMLKDKDKINNTIIHDEQIDDSTNVLNFPSKQCLDSKKSLNNNDISRTQLSLNRLENNQNQNYLGDKNFKKSYFDQFQEKRASQQEYDILNKCNSNKNSPDLKTCKHSQYEINQILENEEETSNNDKIGTSSNSETSKFQSKSNSQKEIPFQNQHNTLSDQAKQNNMIFFPTQNQNQSLPQSVNCFQFKLKEFYCNSNLNQSSHPQIFNQNIQTQINSNDNLYSDEKRDNEENKKILKKSSEYLFHLGIHASLKQFILNSDKKLNIYLSYCKYKNYKNKIYDSSYKTLQNYLVYVTDQYFQITNKYLMEQLTQLLISLDTELLVLILNNSQQLDESNNLENISIEGQQIKGFFNTEEKLLQYIYNNREHLKNYFMPMVLEHF
ncbi:hypothetical protein ABPG72_018215 [Tetrahymena utriculariae]